MLKRLYKQPKKIGRELDAILKRLTQVTDFKLDAQKAEIEERIGAKVFVQKLAPLNPILNDIWIRI